MSKATTKNRIQTEITSAITSNSITPTIVGTILDEIIELPIVDSRPYKVYAGTIYQFGTSDPIIIVSENTLGGVPVWSRVGVGTYRAELTNGFGIGFDRKHTFLLTNGDGMGQGNIGASRQTPSFIQIRTYLNNVVADSILEYASFELKIYP